MKIEFNSDFVNNVKKQFSKEKVEGRRRNRFKKRNINKSYYVLLIVMVLFFGANLSRKSNTTAIDESAAPVFSNLETSKETNDVKDTISKIYSNFSLPVDSNSILSYNYASGIINMKVKKNENVYSMTSGVVDNVFLDYSYGYSVVIKYSDDITCKYSNLDSDAMVKIGDKVDAGTIIGKTLDYSLLDASYLYISVYYKNEAVDITKYLNI
ncbi:MAG: M23 family metallopeptidase [Clostridia bacterium]|nr:M23 family metallopeptidase [Clostridia bacterium]